MTAEDIIEQFRIKLEWHDCSVSCCDGETKWDATKTCVLELAELSVDQMIKTFSSLFMTEGSLLLKHLTDIKQQIRKQNPELCDATTEQ